MGAFNRLHANTKKRKSEDGADNSGGLPNVQGL